jgi:Uma2 family endonuclease
MVAPTHQRMTVEDFEAFVDLPENADRNFEFIGGEIVEVPSNPYSSHIAARIVRYLAAFVDDNNLGHVTTEAGGYKVYGERYAPDVAYISNKRQPELPRHGYNPNAPDLAVEVVSPSDKQEPLLTKVTNYLAAGTVVWVIYPDEKKVSVLLPGQPPKTLTIEDTLDGGDLLPGFSLPVKNIFPAKPE